MQTYRDSSYKYTLKLTITKEGIDIVQRKRKRKMWRFFSKELKQKFRGTIIGDTVIFDKKYINNTWVYLNAEDVIVCKYEIGRNKTLVLRLQ